MEDVRYASRIKKKDFLEISKIYQSGRKRFRNIKPGDMVWEGVPRSFDMDYHPAVVKAVNVDECYIDVIDVTRDNKEYRYEYFITEEEMLKERFTRETLDGEHKKYEGIVKKVLEGKI